MFRRSLLAAALATACAPTWASEEIDAIRAEIATMKQDYEARIAALEARIKEAEGHGEAHAHVEEAQAGDDHHFGPEIGLVLQGRYARRDDIEERGIHGFVPMGGHGHGSERGFAIDHSELMLSAGSGHDWRGHAVFALADDEVEVEEAWFQTYALGHGTALTGGRFYSGLGYLNDQHPHAWDFADAPLMYQALFGERYNNDGLQLRWRAPTDSFLELGLEAGRGGVIVGDYDGNGVGAWTAFAKLGGNLGHHHNWGAGLAYLSAKPRDREGHWEDDNEVETGTLFSGSSKTWVADLVWKWAPEGDIHERSLKFQAEWFRRSESGDLSCEDNTTALPVPGACTGIVDHYDSRQSGWYAQGVYQFMPRWRAGLRYDRLDSGRQRLGTGFDGILSTVDYAPSRTSLMLDYLPIESSRLRVQYARDESMQGITENQWTVQYIMTLTNHNGHDH